MKMLEVQRRRTLTEAPTFARIGNDTLHPPIVESESAADDDNLPMNDFEFAFTMDVYDPGASTKTTDCKMLTNGQVIPVYPIFNQNITIDSFETSPEQELVESIGRLALPFEKHDLRSGSSYSSTSTSSEVDDPVTHCWAQRSMSQSSDRWRINQSMGSTMSEFRRFRLRDLFVSRRRSDEKVKLTVFPAAEKEVERGGFCTIPCQKAMTEAGKKAMNGKGKGKGGEMKEMDVVTAHRIFYGKGITVGRRSFLPYQPGLIGGFFGHRKHPLF